MIDENLYLKGNSNASKNENNNRVGDKVVTTNVIIKKESEASKLKKKFFAEDIRTVSGHVVDSVVIPSLQKILSDIVKGGIDYLIYGSKVPKSQSGPGLISYNNYYNRTSYPGVSPYSIPINGNSPSSSISQPSVYAIDEVIFRERSDAEEVLLRMKEAISSYGMVSVADFYDLINQRCDFTARKYGWRDLKTADIIRINDGFSIRFPRITPIE